MLQTPMNYASTLANTTPLAVLVGFSHSGQNVNQGITSLAQPNTTPQFAYFTPPTGTYGTQLPSLSTFQQAQRYSKTMPFVGNIQQINTPITETEILTQQMENIKKQMTNMQAGNDKNSYTKEDLCLYPFEFIHATISPILLNSKV